jgi:hypothetical protein
MTIDDNGTRHSAIFYGGVIQPQYDAEKNELRPSVGWAVLGNDPAEAKKRQGQEEYR